MLSQEDPVLATAMDSANWVFADSAPVAGRNAGIG